MTDKNDEETRHINCFSCEHFYITRKQSYPYGCSIIGFKSARMPSVDVYMKSAIKCGLFAQKERKQKE